MAVLDRFYGTGRRKTSVARVWIRPGAGRIRINNSDGVVSVAGALLSPASSTSAVSFGTVP